MPELRESLRPCPFCGSGEREDDRIHLRVVSDPQRFFSVSCWCGTFGPVRESEKEAVRDWNTRDFSDQQFLWNPFTPAIKMVPLDFKGNLKSITLPTILQILSSDSKTGILQFSQGQKRRAICLKDGKIIAGSGQPGPPNQEQFLEYFKMGGKYLITSTINTQTLDQTLTFMQKFNKNFGFTCGWAPQTVTYTPKNKYNVEWNKWLNFVEDNQEKFLAIGEIGLDFHHARTLEQRNNQVRVFRQILELTKEFNKPYVLHVRNAAGHEIDRQNPKHRFNKLDGVNKEILKILKEFSISPKKVLWHCFSGPEEYGRILPNQGYMLSVPSSSYGFDRWRKATKNSPLKSLVTETDSYYQHPYKRGPLNIPSNVRYSIAAIAYSHNVPQKLVSETTVKNAIDFFNLPILTQ